MLEQEVLAAAQAAKNASPALAQATTQERNAALTAMARALREQSGAIVAANAQDMDAARQAGTKESLLDRLMLDEGRVMAMADALEDLVALPDPLSRVFDSRTLDSGIRLSRVAVPLGVVAVVYEARPNVTADAAGICLKSGNACVLRGGSLAARSCAAIAHVLHDAAVSAGMPAGCIGIIESTDRAAADVLMGLRGVVDVLVPRGGAGLIAHCVDCAKVPVIETGNGQLSCVRSFHGRLRYGAKHRRQRQVPPLRRVQRLRDAARRPVRGRAFPAGAVRHARRQGRAHPR